MAKFNSKTTTKTTNLAGGSAYKVSTKFEFVSLLLTSFIKSQFYRSEQEQIKTAQELFSQIPDKLFLAKTAVYARTKFGMRSITHVIAGEIAHSVKGENWTKNFFDKIAYRVDDMTEIMSYYLSVYKKPIPNSLKRGFAKAMGKFNEYQLAKYRGEGKGISLVDLVNLIHPKATNGNSQALNKLINGKLVSFDTWEVELTKAGSNAELKSNAWKRLINERKIGYFALLRNLRNILQQADTETVNKALELLIDEKLIKDSLVLPFRFSTAFDEIEKIDGSRNVITAISKALEISLNNVPKFEGTTLIALDESGSMQGKPIKIGSLFASVLYKTNNADLLCFSERARFRNLNPTDSIMSNANLLERDFIGAGTDFHCIFTGLKKVYDRIIILSDMQGWIGNDSPTAVFNQYKTKYNCNPYVYSFDLQGYGTTQLPANNIICIAGFSDKIFDIMKLMEGDKNALISEIEKLEL